MPIQILGYGTALPEFSATQEQAAAAAVALFGEALHCDGAIRQRYRRSGVSTRHSVVLDGPSEHELPNQSFFLAAQHTSDLGPTTAARMQRYEASATALATRACRAALAAAEQDGARVRHLVTVSCSGFSAPGFDIGVIEELGLSAEVTRTHVGFMGCHGALNGLRAARALAAAEPESLVLLCCVELCSLHQSYSAEPQHLVANSLFADGAAAVVLGAGSEAQRQAVIDHYSVLIPETRHLMGWRIGDHGFEMSLAPEIPFVIETHIRAALSGWLSRHALTIEQIGAWAIHPGGPRILTAAADGLGIDRAHLSVSQDVLSRCGNMSSPTVLFILAEQRQRNAAGPTVALAFGPGLAVEAALIGV